MDNLKIKLLFESSPWLLAACVLLAVAYAYFLYQKKAPWGKTTNWILSVLRGILSFLLAILLLNFFIRKTENKIQKRVVGLVFDNSKSINAIGMANIVSLKQGLNNLKASLLEKDIEVEIGSFGNYSSLDSIQFNQNSTNLSKLLGNFKSKNEGRNISEIILVSDGINNQGVSPSNLKSNIPIYSLGVGDTTRKKDIILKNIIANNIAYKGNDFVVQAEIFSNGLVGKSTQVSISQDGKVLSSKSINLPNSFEPSLIEFKINSNKIGLNKFIINASPIAGESNIKNNTREVFIDILDGQQKILLLAASPHPDIKALKTIIENNENYKLTIGIANIESKIDFNQKFDLVILHQLPDEPSSFDNEIKQLKQKSVPIFYIVGNLTSIPAINLTTNEIDIGASSVETDKVIGSFNDAFTDISFDKTELKLLDKLPPLIVPFGEFRTPNQVVLYQKIGNTVTQKPLLVVNNKIPKSAFLLGEGLWAWRMEEFSITQKTDVMDNFFTKIIQFLATTDDSRKLRVYPVNREFDLNEPIQLETETYNNIFQKTYNNNIKLVVSDGKAFSKAYQYKNIEGNSTFQISGLASGIYKYTATTEINGKTEMATGEFVIKNIDYETENLQADFLELQKIAQNSGGEFFKINQIGNLENRLLSKEYIEKIESEENLNELINWPWLLFLILLLATIEWAARKYLGGY